MLTHRRSLLLVVALAAGCADAPTGGVTAKLVFEDAPSSPGASRKALRLAAPPPELRTLEISLLKMDGTVEASVVLSRRPNFAIGEVPLDPAGGTWTLSGVHVGTGYTLVARGYFGQVGDPTLIGALAFEGKIANITVRPAETTPAGVLTLTPPPGQRIPRLDTSPPGIPSPVTVTPVPEGESLIVELTTPDNADLRGFVIATDPNQTVTPTISRGFGPLRVGREIWPGVRIARVIDTVGSSRVRLDGFPNGIPVRVLVFAYDGDQDNAPLNYSQPAEGIATPADTAPPGEVGTLTAVPSGAASAMISFLGTGEDGPNGVPDHYDVRASQTREPLEDPDTFDRLTDVGGVPERLAPGEGAMIVRTFEQLGVSGTDPFFVGVRAVDRAGNLGPITITTYTPQAVTPVITEMIPEVAIAGGELELRGRRFGIATGTVAISTGSSTITGDRVLPVTRWSDEGISVHIPEDVKSGTLRIIRATAGVVATRFLPVVVRVGQELDPAPAPMQFVGAPRNGETRGALYVSRPVGPAMESSVQRFFGLRNEGIRHVPLVTAERLTAVGGTWSQRKQRFLFVASTQAETMLSGALINSSTGAAQAVRFTAASNVGNADGIGVEILDSGSAAQIPALIAVSRNNRISTSFSSDIATTPFTTFNTITASLAVSRFVTMRRSPNDVRLLLAYQAGGDLFGTLVLMDATANAQGSTPFVRRIGTAPPAGPRIEIIGLPTGEFIIAYEERKVGGRRDVRLLRAGDYGSGPGYAPFAESRASRRLEDVGLVTRAGNELAIALLTSRLSAGAALNYVEVPLSDLNRDGRGNARGVELETGPEDASARLGCKPLAASTCPIAFAGPRVPNIFFLRR